MPDLIMCDPIMYLMPDPVMYAGTTTIAAIVICYGLGVIVWYGESTLAIMLAIITTILLYFKAELHGITQTRQARID